MSWRMRRAAPHSVFPHHLDQHALTQATIGDAQPLAWKRSAHGVENGTACEHKVGAFGADTGVCDTVLVARSQEPFDDTAHFDVSHPAAVDPAAVITLEIEMNAGDCRHG